MFKALRLFLMFLVLVGVGTAMAKELWYCPMHPSYTSDRAGLCPICNMSLVKKADHPSEKHALQEHEKNSVPEHGAVSLDSRQIQLIGVKTTSVTMAPLLKTVRAPGYVSTNNDLYQYQNEYIQAHLSYVLTYRDYKRFQHARRNWDTHRDLQVKLHDAEDKLLRFGLGHAEIEKLQSVSRRTPWDQPDMLFFKEGSLNYWVVTQVFESDRGFVTAGQDVEVQIDAYHEKAKGVIRSIGGVFDSQTRTVNALVELIGYRGELAGNMFVNVTIPVELNESLIVPKDAVMDTGLRKIVFVQEKPGVFIPRAIEVTAQGDNGWAVKSGVKKDEIVVVDGNFLLDSESRLQAAFSAATTGEHSHGQ